MKAISLIGLLKSTMKVNVLTTTGCIKRSLALEDYLLKLPVPLRFPVTNFLLSSHKPPIKNGRYANTPTL